MQPDARGHHGDLAPIDERKSRAMRAQRERDTGIEREIRSRLHARGLRFRLHRRLLKGSRREVDVVFPGAKVAVFVDGCFWHGCPEHGTWPRNNAEFWKQKIEGNVARDRDTDARLQAEGWTVVRVWEHEAPGAAAARIADAVGRNRRIAAMPYTLRNLREDPDDVGSNFDGPPDLEFRHASKALGLEQSGLSFQRIPPDYRFPVGHTHKTQEEVYVVVGGSGRMKLDDEIVEVGRWDAVRVPPGVWRGYEAGPDGLEILVIGAPHLGDNPRDDVEGRRDWWTD
jgi:DNA mismatch endonuclease Vsr